MKTGLIVEADDTPKGLDNICVKRVFINGEDWEKNVDESTVNITDTDRWISILVEGITTIIFAAHEAKVKDSAEYLREVISKMEKAFIQPANTNLNIDPDHKDYLTN